jgi:hypothetical protein
MTHPIKHQSEDSFEWFIAAFDPMGLLSMRERKTIAHLYWALRAVGFHPRVCKS